MVGGSKNLRLLRSSTKDLDEMLINERMYSVFWFLDSNKRVAFLRGQNRNYEECNEANSSVGDTPWTDCRVESFLAHLE